MTVRGRRLRGEPRDDHVRPERRGSRGRCRRGRPAGPRSLSVSSESFEYPKSFARVKYCRPPSSRRAASSSCVRATPSCLAELGAEQVLSAVAAREREIGRPVSAAARQVGDGLRVLVVRMRGDVEHAAHAWRSCAATVRWRPRSVARRRGRRRRSRPGWPRRGRPRTACSRGCRAGARRTSSAAHTIARHMMEGARRHVHRAHLTTLALSRSAPTVVGGASHCSRITLFASLSRSRCSRRRRPRLPPGRPYARPSSSCPSVVI